jgi:hypothetical protein
MAPSRLLAALCYAALLVLAKGRTLSFTEE